MSMPREFKSAIIKATRADRSSPSKHAPVVPGRAPDWDTYFDGKFVLAYTGYTDRIPGLRDEFARVGMKGVEFVWNTDDKFAMEFFGECGKSRPDIVSTALGQFRFFNNGLGHYRIIKGAYQRGFEHILVMEDDIKFLRDTDTIQRILADIPSDYEVAMLDSHGLVENRGAPYWRIVDPQRTSAGCYALSRDGMAKMIAIYETRPYQNSDGGFCLSNFDKIYYCYPLIARQVPGAWWRAIYDSMGSSAEEYGK